MSFDKDFNRGHSGNILHGSNYAERMGVYERSLQNDRLKQELAARQQVFTPPAVPSSFNAGTNWTGARHSDYQPPAAKSQSSGGSWAPLAWVGLWVGSAIGISALLKWLGVGADLADSIGWWALPAVLGAALAAAIVWALWLVAKAIAKGIAAIVRGVVAMCRWINEHRKPLMLTAAYGVSVAVTCKAAIAIRERLGYEAGSYQWQLLGWSLLGVLLAFGALWVVVRLRRHFKKRASQLRPVAVAHSHCVEPTQRPEAGAIKKRVHFLPGISGFPGSQSPPSRGRKRIDPVIH